MQTRTVEDDDDMIVTTFVAEDDMEVTKIVPKEEEEKKKPEEEKKTEEVKVVQEKMEKLAVEQAESDDEEDFQPVVHDAVEEEKDDGFKVEEAKLTETLIVFAKNQFLLYDFKKNASWQVGDVEGGININDASSTVMVDPQKHRTNQFMAITSGGSLYGMTSNNVYGLVFDQMK